MSDDVDPWAKFSPEEREWLASPPTRSEVYRLFIQITVILGRLARAGADAGGSTDALADAERRLDALRAELSKVPGMNR